MVYITVRRNCFLCTLITWFMNPLIILSDICKLCFRKISAESPIKFSGDYLMQLSPSSSFPSYFVSSHSPPPFTHIPFPPTFICASYRHSSTLFILNYPLCTFMPLPSSFCISSHQLYNSIGINRYDTNGLN
jgi:hypothetical protein